MKSMSGIEMKAKWGKHRWRKGRQYYTPILTPIIYEGRGMFRVVDPITKCTHRICPDKSDVFA